ncbi:MAG: precorrin-6y C5,15-methyltransferase (decarboxylating) subunit CbiE [Pseudomonadota bacterium]
MNTPWLHVIGIGEDGLVGLSAPARGALEGAVAIFGGARHLAMVESVAPGATRHAWPTPFAALIDDIRAHRPCQVAVLATGDPLWYSVGEQLATTFEPEEVAFYTQVSAFQIAAARMGWSLADCEMLTAHGRPVSQIMPYVAPAQRLLILTAGVDTPFVVASRLTEAGYGPSRLAVLTNMGGVEEMRFDGIAERWNTEVPALHTLAVECVAGPQAQALPRTGLPDAAFEHDGKMTKSEVRAVTLARLCPAAGALLWDIGCGAGSVAIEWMRGARRARAVGIEPNASRCATAARNAEALGAPGLQIISGRAPDALDGLEPPDAIFVGGGLSREVFERAWSALKPKGRLVANAVTLESEAMLLALQSEYGGELARLSVARADPVGHLTGWRPLMPVTQWSHSK